MPAQCGQPPSRTRNDRQKRERDTRGQASCRAPAPRKRPRIWSTRRAAMTREWEGAAGRSALLFIVTSGLALSLLLHGAERHLRPLLDQVKRERRRQLGKEVAVEKYDSRPMTHRIF